MGFPRWRTTMCFVSGRRRNVGSSTLKQVDFQLEAVGRGGFWVKRFLWIQWKSSFVMDWWRGKNMYDIYISIYYCVYIYIYICVYIYIYWRRCFAIHDVRMYIVTCPSISCFCFPLSDQSCPTPFLRCPTQARPEKTEESLTSLHCHRLYIQYIFIKKYIYIYIYIYILYRYTAPQKTVWNMEHFKIFPDVQLNMEMHQDS